MLLFAIAAAFAPRLRLQAMVADNAISLLAILGFCGLALAGALSKLPGHGGLALQFGAATHALAPYRAFEGLSSLCGPLAAFGLGALSCGERQARDWAGRWVTLFALLYGGVGLWMFFSNIDERLDVGISSANAAATLFGTLAIVASALIVRAARGRLGERISLPPSLGWVGFGLQAPLSLAALIAALSCLMLTASRGGLVATVAGFLVLFLGLLGLLARNRSLRAVAVFAPVVVCGVIAAILFLRGGGPVLERFALTQEDLGMRQQIAAAHWTFVKADPWFGSGLNDFFELNTLAATPENWRAVRVVGAVHNIYIQALEEMGVAGLVLLVLAIAPLLARSVGRIASGGSGAEWSAALLGVSALIFLHGLVDFGLEVPAIAAFYAFLLGSFAGTKAQPSRP